MIVSNSILLDFSLPTVGVRRLEVMNGLSLQYREMLRMKKG